MFDIKPISHKYDKQIQTTIDNKTKPLGALGELEVIAKKIAQIQLNYADRHSPDLSTDNKLSINHPHLTVFAGDHGVAKEGVSIAPSEVTGQMVANFANGGAAINVFCRQFGWQLKLVDAGILTPVDESLGVINQRLGDTTQAIHQHQAMSGEQVKQGFLFAKAHVESIKTTGCNLIAFGEMGIGNTTCAAAIMAAVMDIPASETVGRGTGVSNEIVHKKQQIIEKAIRLHKDNLTNAMDILACLGGFEIVQITAAMLSAAENNMIILVDGFICSAAAMLAIMINSNVRDYMIFAHCSGEQGHEKMLQWLGEKPLLNIGLRLGEGTGAALALPLIEAAVNFYNDMASFEQAEVTKVV